MHTKCLLASLASLLLLPPVLAQTLSPSEIFRLVSPSVVVVKVYDKQDRLLSLGSGVVIDDGVVVTNCHVLNAKDAQYAQVQYHSKNLDAELRHADVERDLCTLGVIALSASPARIGSSRNVEVGTKVFAVGAPEGYELTLSDGLVSGKRELNGNQYIQVTTPISHGSSGGGLFDDTGRLVGITTLMDTSGQALNFAIPAEWIAEISHRNTFHPKASEQNVPEPPLPKRKADGPLPSPDETPSADRWKRIATDVDGSTIDIDTKSIHSEGGYVNVWVRTKFPRPQKMRTVSGIVEDKSLESFDCSRQTVRIVTFSVFGVSGNHLRTVAGDGEFDPVPPETVAEATMKSVCGAQ